jgi:phosphohistidine phosphatase SixA
MHRRHWLAAAAGLGLGPPATAQAPPAGPTASNDPQPAGARHNALEDAATNRAVDYPTLLRSHGLVVLLRHAVTEPGIGDPPGYRLDDCSSQRQLSAEGRAQASRLGITLAALGLRPAKVLSSRWCRCQDTARLAFGRVAPWPALDSFFDAPEREPAQTAMLRTALAALVPGEVVAWVTHMVNVAALSGDSLAMGEALVLRAERAGDGSLRLLRLGRVGASGRG